ncbi:MAG: hypothetical protein N4A72_22015 [Bacteroidales bacterium]|jgi:hypothetical protein|nr:hypothetical protein [Bacteroidales bacterium]
MSNNEIVDMTKLTQKELLILLNSKVEMMGKTLELQTQENKKITENYASLKERVSNLETKNKVYAGIVAVISSIITTIVISLIKR